MTGADFTFIAALLKERSGLVITPDKGYLLETRLSPIVRERGLPSLSALMDVLRQPGSEPVRAQVVDAMTTNETSFFRDSHPFDTLRKSVIPGLIERRAGARALRIWSAACSTGAARLGSAFASDAGAGAGLRAGALAFRRMKR